jgi:type II secretory pathway pseudopilin PulG
MRSRRGITLVEIMITLVIMAVAVSLISIAVIGEIDKARGSVLMSEAHSVYLAAQTVMIEEKARGDLGFAVYDEDYSLGLSGIVNDASLSYQTRLSERMSSLLYPDIILGAAPTEEISSAAFDVKNGEIISITYDAIDNGRHYRITVYPDGEATVERIN